MGHPGPIQLGRVAEPRQHPFCARFAPAHTDPDNPLSASADFAVLPRAPCYKAIRSHKLEPHREDWKFQHTIPARFKPGYPSSCAHHANAGTRHES